MATGAGELSSSAGRASGDASEAGPDRRHAADDRFSLGAAMRSIAGGALMGLANLVPGISGGTMLVASGIYQRFIDAISDATRLRLRAGSIATLLLVIGSGGAAIVLLAGAIGEALIQARWAMYALFIGLTLGGLPLLLEMASPRTPAVWIAAACGAAGMVALALVQEGSTGGNGASGGMVMLFLAGIAGASAMILPGVSGAYLLLLLGQYRAILESIDRFKTAAEEMELSIALAEWRVIVPVGVGVVVGVVAVSNVLRVLLHRYEKATLGVLIGLLLGAPAGLYPFKRGVEPEVGDVIRGEIVTEQTLPEALEDPRDWAEEAYMPEPSQIAGALALIGAGFGGTLGLSRLGRARKRHEAT